MHTTLIFLLAASMVVTSGGSGAGASDAPITPDRKIPLFNGKDLSNWEPDVPARDKDPTAPASFVVRNGMLVSLGKPEGHLLTRATYRDYRLEAEYRFPGQETGVPRQRAAHERVRTERRIQLLDAIEADRPDARGAAAQVWPGSAATGHWTVVRSPRAGTRPRHPRLVWRSSRGPPWR